jgi:hypothetical protein
MELGTIDRLRWGQATFSFYRSRSQLDLRLPMTVVRTIGGRWNRDVDRHKDRPSKARGPLEFL